MSEENRMTEADVRRSRMLCRLATAVFTGCGLLFFATTFSMPVRAVVGGFNLVVAVAVLLYGNSLRADS